MYTLRENAHQLRHQQAAHNLTLIRKMALNLLARDTTKMSLKRKRKRLGWDDAYLEDLLQHICHQLDA